MMKFLDAHVHFFDDHRVRVPHRPAAMCGESEAVQVDDVQDGSLGSQGRAKARPYICRFADYFFSAFSLGTNS